MSTFQDRLRQMEEKYGSGAMGSAKTGTGSSGSSDKSTRYQSLLAEMDAKYGGGTTGSGSAASTSSGKPTRYQSILAEMDAKYGGGSANGGDSFHTVLGQMDSKYGSVQPASTTYTPAHTGKSATNTSGRQTQEAVQKSTEAARGVLGTVSGKVRDIGNAITRGKSSAYYKRPDFWGDAETLYGNIIDQEPTYMEQRLSVEKAQKAVQEAGSALVSSQEQFDQIYGQYQENPSSYAAARLREAKAAMNQAQKDYDAAYSGYTAAYDAYQPTQAQYADAVSAYQEYARQQQNAFTDWRATIRDQGTIQGELDALDQKISALEKERNRMLSGTERQAANYSTGSQGMYGATGVSGTGTQATAASGLGSAGFYGANGTVNSVADESKRAKLEEIDRQMQELQSQRELLQEESEWSQYYRYADLTGADDFAEKSKYVSTAKGNVGTRYTTEQWVATDFQDLFYDYVNKNRYAKLSLDSSDTYWETPDISFVEQMSDTEIGTYNYIYATEGKDAAKEYIRYLESNLNARQRAERTEYWANQAVEHPVLTSALSLAMSPFKGLSYVGQAVDYLKDGGIDQNASYNQFSYIPNTIRSAVSQKIAESGKWGGVGSFAYQTGMSMGDFLLNTAITGGNQPLTLAIMGTGAAADATIDAKDRGLTDDQAFLLGTIAGAAEIVTEKVSLETLLNPELLADGTVKYILKNVLAEGSEEAASDLINFFADVLISKDQSEWMQSIAEYQDSGKSQNEAFWLSIRDQAEEIGLDFLGGAISGGLMAGAGAVGNKAHTYKTVKKANLTDSDIQTFISTGLESDPDTKSHKIAAELQQKLNFGKKLTTAEINRLWRANMQSVDAETEQVMEENPVSETGTEAENSSNNARGAFEQYYEDAHRPDVETVSESDTGTGSESKNPGETDSMERAHMRNLLKSGSVDAETADWILKNPEFRKAFEAETGITVTGTEEQQKNLVMNAAALYAERESIRNPNQTTQVDDTIRESMKSSGEALGYSGDTLTGFVAGYRGNISAEEYRDAYNGFYTYGKLAAESGSLSFDRAVNSMSVYARRLGNPAAMAAFNRGKADATSSRTARTAHRPAKKGTGTFTDKTTSGKKRQGYGALVNTLEKFSKKTGIDVELVDSLKSGKYKANGRILLDTMTIQLAADGDNPMAALGHEAGEYLLAYNPEGYAQVREQLLSWWVEHENANSIDALIKAYQERYQNAGQAGKTWNEAANEAVNDALGAMLTTDAGMEQFVQWVQTDSGLSKTEQKSLFQKIGDMIRSVIDGLKNLLEGSKDTPMQKRILEMEINKQQEILDTFLKAVDGTKVTEAQKNTAQMGGEMQYSLDQDYSEQLDRWYQEWTTGGKGNTGGYLRVGTTSDVLQSIGVRDTVIIWDTGKIGKILREHPSVTLDVLKQIPQVLEKPIVVMQSKTALNRIVMLAELTDTKGKPVLAVLELRPDGRRRKIVDFVTVASAYGKSGVQNLLDTSDILYVDPDKKRTDSWSEILRLQLPTEITRYGSIGRVTYVDRNVNGEYVFGEENGKTAIQEAFEQAWKKRSGENPNARYSLDVPESGVPQEQQDAWETAYSISAGEITPGMDDESRAEVLNGKVVTAPEYDASDPVTGAQIIKLKGQYARDAKKILKALAEHCGVFDIDYYNADIELEFTYTRSSLSESINKQVIRHGSMSDFGKMLTVLPGICSGAVEVDAQTDRYSGTKRADPNLKEMHILVGAFLDGERVVPVKLEIKEYKKNSERSNRLYVSITAKMEAGIYLSDRTTNTGGDGLSTPASEISLAYIVGNVKDQTGSFVKYFPDSMLSGEQIQAKEAATTAEKTHLADMRYEYAAERGDVETTSRMLSDRASQMGYSTDTGWRMSHRAPNQESGVSLDKADSAFGGDGSIYASMAVQYFGEGRAYDRKALAAISRAKNNPNTMVTAYRAVPNSVQETQLRNGDWVTLTREYAQEHGERTFDGGFRVISQRVPASHLFTNGDSIHEFGYDNGRTDEVYKNTANGRKMTSVTYDDFGNLIPLSARFDDTVSDPRYSLDVPEPGVPQEQQDAWESVFNADSASREAYNDMSSEVEKAERAAAEAVRAARKQGLAEGDLLGQMYRGRIEGQRAASLEERLKNAKQVIRALKQQISAAQKKGRSDSRSIERLKRDLSRQESALDASRQRLADYREGRNERDAVAKGRLSVEKKAKALAKMLTTNTDKAHVPEDLKDAIGQLLQSLDFSSKRRMEGGGSTYLDMDYDAMMTKVRNALAAHSKFDGEAGAWMDLPDGFLESIQKHIDTVKDSVRGISGMQTNQVYRMNSVQLADLAHILTVVKTSLENINAFYVQGRKQTVTQAADSTIRFAKKHGSAAGNPDGRLRRQLEWDNTVPIYAFSRFGDGGNQVFQGTQDGWDKLSFNVRKILDFKKGVFTDQEAQEWGKQLHEITLESGDVVTMSTAQIMSIVCLSKRSRAVQHMMQGGIRIANIQVEGKPGKADTLRQTTNYNLTLADLNNIGKLLTDKQKSVAMEIQKFMEEQGSEWGNEVSMRRFGYRAFTESNYFPIASDPTNLPAFDPEARKNDMFRLMNLSFTKATMEKANNAIVISNIFEVFGDHMADMAKYNALTLPILDMLKWYNYVDRVEGVNGQYTTRSVQRSILDAYGEGAGNYITTFLKDLNGIHEFGRGEGFMSKFVSNYKAAAVGANLRVAILQPTAYARAWVVMDAGYLRRGLKMSARKGAAEMERYSGIGNWKSMGFYDTNVNRGIRQQLSGEGTAMDTVRDKSMAAAELMDKLTWGALWNACKLETMEKQGLSGEELMQATALRFREIVYKTQVVDSTMTRSQNMRSGSMAMKFATAFMSEPTLSYNLVMDAYLNFRDAQRSGTNLEKGNARKRMVRSFAAYAVSALAGAIMESLADALRDDDDYESYLRKFWEAFWGWDGNLVSDIRISNKIPFFKDIASVFGGNTVDRMDLASFHDLKEAWDIWKETVELAIGKLDKPTSVTYYGNMTTYGKIYKALRAISGLSGIPLASSTREVITLWNNTAGILYPDLKVKTYNAGDEKEILNALEDGYITADAAVQLLTEKVKDEKTGDPMSADDAYWKVKQIVTGYGKTGELEAALESGDEQHIQDCVDEMLAHGFEEKDIPGKITSAIRDLYTKDADGNTGEGRISREQAQNLLREYAGKEEKDIFWNLQVWDQILDGVEDAGKYRELYDAVSTGKNLKPTVKFYLDNGIGKDTLSQRLSDEFRETYTELYRTDRSAADSMKRNLLDAYEALGYDRKEKETTISGWVYDGELSDALESGNDKSIRSTIKSMVAGGYDWQYVPGKVSSLVKALYTKDSNGELGAGRISRETAKKLLTTYADMDETDVFWALRDWDRIAAGETNVNRYDDLHQAVSSGKSIQQTVKFYLDNGIGKSTLSQNLTSTYKQQYIDLYYSDPKAASALKKRLLDAYAAMGYDRSKKAKVIDGWIADAKD